VPSRPQEFDTDVDLLDHVQEIGLVDQLFSRVIEHSRRMVKFLEIFEVCADVVREFDELIL